MRYSPELIQQQATLGREIDELAITVAQFDEPARRDQVMEAVVVPDVLATGLPGIGAARGLVDLYLLKVFERKPLVALNEIPDVGKNDMTWGRISDNRERVLVEMKQQSSVEPGAPPHLSYP